VVESSGLLNRSAVSSKSKKINHNLLPAKLLQPFRSSPDFTDFHPI
jgi:hypothetical protein